MSETAVGELESVLEQDDEQFKAELPAVLPSVADEPEELLGNQPEAFRDLATRMATLEGMDEYADEEPETVEAYLELLWDSLELISETVPEVGDDLSQEFTVTWRATDSDVTFHMEADPDDGTITGGPGELEGSELTFEGETDVMFSMLGDDDFDGVQAFMQGKFEIDGPIPKAQQLSQVMESTMDDLENQEL